MADLTPCDIGELLSAYLDGELLPGELDRVTSHLGDCEDCVLEFRKLKESRTALRLLPVLEMPEWLLDDVAHLGPELSAYLDGELVTAEFPMVIDHLRECAQCREELVGLDSARAAVRALPRVEPPTLLDVHRAKKERKETSRWRVASAIAGVAAVVVLTLGFASSPPPDEAPNVDSFADRHIARASVESGFSMLPALAPTGVSP